MGLHLCALSCSVSLETSNIMRRVDDCVQFVLTADGLTITWCMSYHQTSTGIPPRLSSHLIISQAMVRHAYYFDVKLQLTF